MNLLFIEATRFPERIQQFQTESNLWALVASLFRLLHPKNEEVDLSAEQKQALLQSPHRIYEEVKKDPSTK